MKQLTVNIKDVQIDRLNQLSEKHEMTISELIRMAIDECFFLKHETKIIKSTLSQQDYLTMIKNNKLIEIENNAILKIKEAGRNGISKRNLFRSIRDLYHMDKKESDMFIKKLTASGSIVFGRSDYRGKGRPSFIFKMV